jgi:8-oxo-dGTP diphosphatase
MTRNRYPVAVHLFFIRDARVLLLRRRNTGWRDGEYSVPAGHVEQGETVTEAALREAREEVGIALDRAALEVVHVMHRAGDGGAPTLLAKRPKDERIDFFLAAREWRGEPVNAEPDKCDDLRWAVMDELPENVIPYIGQALRCWREGVVFSEFGWGRGDALLL